MLVAAYTPGCFEEFIDLVVPEPPQRGRYRTAYGGATLPEICFNVTCFNTGGEGRSSKSRQPAKKESLRRSAMTGYAGCREQP